jgi:hypothetical protein
MAVEGGCGVGCGLGAAKCDGWGIPRYGMIGMEKKGALCVYCVDAKGRDGAKCKGWSPLAAIQLLLHNTPSSSTRHREQQFRGLRHSALLALGASEVSHDSVYFLLPAMPTSIIQCSPRPSTPYCSSSLIEVDRNNANPGVRLNPLCAFP